MKQDAMFKSNIKQLLPCNAATYTVCNTATYDQLQTIPIEINFSRGQKAGQIRPWQKSFT